MLTRIVKMTYMPEEVPAFLKIFDESKQRITAFKGCEGLRLLHDINNPNIFFTYSHWQNETYLDAYRQSDLFNGVWKQTKALFSEKAEAWSVQEEDVVK